MIPSHESRISGGLIGLLVGDALGVPYEFRAAASLPPLAELEMTPPDGFRRAHAGVPPGTWSDDGAQSLCLLDSLLDKGSLDLAHFAGRLLAWFHHGLFAVDGNVFDIGIQTRGALQAIASGTGHGDAWTDAVRTARAFVSVRELDDFILPRFEEPMRGSGYVLDTLHAAVALNAAGSFEAVVKNAIALGDDTDTTACVAGGIAGIRFGLEGVPDRWRDSLRGREILQPLLSKLTERSSQSLGG